MAVAVAAPGVSLVSLLEEDGVDDSSDSSIIIFERTGDCGTATHGGLYINPRRSLCRRQPFRIDGQIIIAFAC